MHTSRYVGISLALLGTAATLAACGSSASPKPAPSSAAAASQTAAPNSGVSFYKGKTLTIVVPYGAGGGYDRWARLLSPYLQQYLGLAAVRIVNKPGGGGIVGTNEIYTSPANGLTIGDTNAGGDVFDQIAHYKGMAFDVSRFDWIGRPDNDPHVLSLRAASPYHSIQDLLKAKTPVRALGTGQGSGDYNASLIILNGFGIPYKMIAAYSGSTAEKAGFLRGDGDVISVSASDINPLVQAKKAIPVMIESDQTFSKLPGVPTIVQVGQQQHLPQATIKAFEGLAGIMDLGHAFIAPPGVPQDRLAALRAAFKQAIENPQFDAAAAKAGLYVGYASPSQLTAWAQAGLSAASEFQSLLVNHSQ